MLFTLALLVPPHYKRSDKTMLGKIYKQERNKIHMEILLAIIGSSATASIVTGIFSLISAKKQKHSGTEKGIQVLLYDRIDQRGEEYVARGYVTPKELEKIIGMHNIYHNDLHGNGYLDSIMERVKKLPIHYTEEEK
jgi:hypothetical protein